MFKKIIVLSLLVVSSIVFLPSQSKATVGSSTTLESFTSSVPAASFQRRNRRSRRWENRRWRNDRNRRDYRRDDRRNNRRGDDRRNNRRRGRGRN